MCKLSAQLFSLVFLTLLPLLPPTLYPSFQRKILRLHFFRLHLRLTILKSYRLSSLTRTLPLPSPFRPLDKGFYTFLCILFDEFDKFLDRWIVRLIFEN